MVTLVQWLSDKMTCFHGAEQGSSLQVVNVHLVFFGPRQARADIPGPRVIIGVLAHLIYFLSTRCGQAHDK
jgi:hypothetical protein